MSNLNVAVHSITFYKYDDDGNEVSSKGITILDNPSRIPSIPLISSVFQCLCIL